MKISVNWLKEYVDLKGIDIKDIVSRFSLTTAEIEGYEEKGKDIKAVVAEIKTCEKIENSKKLSKLTVFDGKKTYPIVCGAPNVRQGLRVALDLSVGKATLAGHESHGMCLSERELGISDDHDGIIELDKNTLLGAPVQDALPYVVDTIIEIDNKSITNRPDLWGHYGIARELSVIFGRPLKSLETTDLSEYEHLPKLNIAIENKQHCLAYGAIRMNNVTLEKTPLQMAVRLYYLDMNPRGFLVDISNYVMLETGQPNHAFDAEKVNKISIGNVAIGQEFVTLGDQKITTTPNMLFIKSDNASVALAGIIGGKNSEIQSGTRACVFEFATFDAGNVRKTASAIGIRTDASARFEKSLDTNLGVTAAARIIHLIQKHDKAAEVVSSFTRAVTTESAPIKLSVDKKYAEKFCGVKFDWFAVTTRLAGLGFAPVVTDTELRVTVPTWRATKDVTCGADVIEEIIRTYGYDNIIPTAPRVELNPVAPLPMNRLVNRVKNLLSSKHYCNEVHTYIWSETQSDLRVVNSCIKGCDWIRCELSPSLLKVASKNKSNTSDIRIFEIGQVFCGRHNTEEKRLSIVMNDYKELSQIVRELFGAKFDLGKATQKYLHPKNNATIEVNGKTIGFIGIVPKQNLATAEINLEFVEQSTALSIKKISKYQKNTLDFTFETKKIYGDVESIFEKFSHQLNLGFKLKDVFEKDDTLSYTLQFTVGSYEKTLTAEDINDVWSKIIAHGRKFGLSLKE